MTSYSTVFQFAISFTLQFEGGLHIDSHDPGGTTSYGIAQRYHPNINVAKLTRQEAVELYYQQYWLRFQCDKLPAALGACLFDAAVNLGGKEATKMLQSSLGVNTDGIIGPKTLAACKGTAKSERDKFLTARAMRYVNDSQFAEYGDGWLRRVIALSSFVMRLET